jgi:hypothetical protein
MSDSMRVFDSAKNVQFILCMLLLYELNNFCIFGAASQIFISEMIYGALLYKFVSNIINHDDDDSPSLHTQYLTH